MDIYARPGGEKRIYINPGKRDDAGAWISTPEAKAIIILLQAAIAECEKTEKGD